MATKLGTGGDASYGLLTKQATVTYADTTAAEIAVLPADSYIVDIRVDVQTAFSGGTTNLDIGTSGTANYFADNVTVSSTGRATVTLTNAGTDLSDRPLSVYCTVAAGNAAGSCTITITYFCASHSHLH